MSGSSTRQTSVGVLEELRVTSSREPARNYGLQSCNHKINDMGELGNGSLPGQASEETAALANSFLAASRPSLLSTAQPWIHTGPTETLS